MAISKDDPGNRNSVAINTFSRVISVIMLTLLFGVGGHYLDKWLDTNFWTVVGFILGGCLTMIGLLYVVKAAEYDRKHPRGIGEMGDGEIGSGEPDVKSRADEGHSKPGPGE